MRRRLSAIGAVGLLVAILSGCGGPEGETTPTGTGGPSAGSNAARTGRCGVERWAVKTLTDPAAAKVDLTPQGTSIEKLTALAAPTEPTARVSPTEMSSFRLSGTLIFAKREADSDYHLVIEDGQGRTMIVEAPAPGCAKGSVALAQIAQARAEVEMRLPELARGQTLRPMLAATVTGVGFFDRIHGQAGVAKNGIELHPLSGIAFTGAPASVPPEQLTIRPGSD